MILGPTRYSCGSSAPASVRSTRTPAFLTTRPVASHPPPAREQASWSLWGWAVDDVAPERHLRSHHSGFEAYQS